MDQLGTEGLQLRQLIEKHFLIPCGSDPLSPFIDYLVARPIQNPAVAYSSVPEETTLVRTSMAHSKYSRELNDLPEVVEEKLSPAAAVLFPMADGTKSLREVSALFEDESELKTAIDFLTAQERQAIKLTPRPEDLADPYKPAGRRIPVFNRQRSCSGYLLCCY